MSNSGQIVLAGQSCRSEDYGQTWQPYGSPPFHAEAVHINRFNSSFQVAGGQNDGVYLSQNSGKNFSKVTGSPNLWWTDFASNEDFTVLCATSQEAFYCANVTVFADTAAPTLGPTSTPSSEPTTAEPSPPPSSKPSGQPSSTPSGKCHQCLIDRAT